MVLVVEVGTAVERPGEHLDVAVAVVVAVAAAGDIVDIAVAVGDGLAYYCTLVGIAAAEVEGLRMVGEVLAMTWHIQQEQCWQEGFGLELVRMVGLGQMELG